MSIVHLPTRYYEQHHADYSLDVPGEGYGGWQKAVLPLNLSHTALVVMHAVDCGTKEQFPGHHRAVEYISRSYDIVQNVFPQLLRATRDAGVKIIHIGMTEQQCEPYAGYAAMKQLAGEETPRSKISGDEEIYKQLLKFREMKAHPGEDNIADIVRGYDHRRFPDGATPLQDEPVVMTTDQLFAWCKQEDINHLIYTGFAINWCLLMSPGGMLDMSRRGLLCSTIEEAVTAVENKETARTELNKQLALWRVALAFGFVYSCEDYIKAIESN